MNVISISVTVFGASLILGSCAKVDSAKLICQDTSRFTEQDPACACPVISGTVSQTTTGATVGCTDNSGGSGCVLAQSFILASSNRIQKVALNLSYANGNTLGGIKISIVADFLGAPTGAILGTGSMTGTLTTAQANYTANLKAPATIHAGTTYWIVAQLVSLTGTVTAGGASGGTPTDGQLGYSTDGAVTWTYQPTRDLFYSLSTCD